MVDSKVLVNGRIYVSFRPIRMAEALVTLNERVAYVGIESKAMELADIFDSDVIDLKGKATMPGFVDSHMHLDWLGSIFETLDLRGCRSIRQLKEKLREYIDGHEEMNYIIGRGWDQELFVEKRYPTRWDIDEVEIGRPVILTRICGHAAVLNSKALEEAGILEKVSSPHLQRDADGEPTGIVTEGLLEFAEGKLQTSSNVRDLLRQFQNGLSYCASKGITTLDFVSCTLESYKALQILRKEGKLLVRVRVHMTPKALDALSALGIRGGYGDSMLKVVGIKAFADGSLGARTAWLSFPYGDQPGEFGSALIGEDELESLARSAEDLDLQIATHAIGDRAIDIILSAYGKIESTKRLRHRIEHCSIVRNDQVGRIKELGAAVTIKPHFVISDWWVTSRIGKERARLAYPFKKMAIEIACIGIGTDCPVEPVNPWETVYAAVTRGAEDGVPLASETQEEKLTLEETLDKYTYGSSCTLNEENDLGTLDPGKYADFVILETDPFSVNVEQIRDLKVLETYVGGRRSFPFNP